MTLQLSHIFGLIEGAKGEIELRRDRMRYLRGLLGICLGLLLGVSPISCNRPVVERSKGDEKDEFVILTPASPETPLIHGAKVFGARPGSPFLFQIAATGKRPIEYSVSNLPQGLQLDRNTGQITGVLESVGRYPVMLRAENQLGATERKCLIICGDRIALTPPMGWNSWNCFAASVSQDKILGAARAMVANGLRDHGWTYVNIDDGWQGKRGGPVNAIQGNSNFPDIQALTHQIHQMGLKVGIYSTPWRTSFLWHIGSSGDNAEGIYDWVGTNRSTELCQVPISGRPDDI